ncbi:expressed unknown protein [Seminavis robusta]|uniref:Uncharacterized protein n=1 Tax=Seminavis robusta TaxID=568900 RepID=A0A9N8DHY5_9STRA|nr:expressed unknown protein [Seminavis robusta]|eukprot:Sro136_g064250.1 n/a (159) ;mRNA; r:97551-98027
MNPMSEHLNEMMSHQPLPWAANFVVTLVQDNAAGRSSSQFAEQEDDTLQRQRRSSGSKPLCRWTSSSCDNDSLSKSHVARTCSPPRRPLRHQEPCALEGPPIPLADTVEDSPHCAARNISVSESVPTAESEAKIGYNAARLSPPPAKGAAIVFSATMA